MTASQPGMLSAALTIARKDLAIELRTRAAFLSAIVFTLLGAAIFYFAWDPTAVPSLDLAPGVLWVIFAFAGVIGLNRSFAGELTDRAIDGLLTAPIPRESIFIGKALANLAFVIGVQIIAIPAVIVLYNVPLGRAAWIVLAIGLLAAIGLVAVGTLFSAMVVNTRLAELLLPMLALPFFVPIVTAAAQATARLVAGRPAVEAMGWIRLLAAFDLVFVSACTVAYPYTIER
jgi:heme exporter protein B